MTGKRANQGSDRLVPDFINGIDPKRTFRSLRNCDPYPP